MRITLSRSTLIWLSGRSTALQAVGVTPVRDPRIFVHVEGPYSSTLSTALFSSNVCSLFAKTEADHVSGVRRAASLPRGVAFLAKAWL